MAESSSATDAVIDSEDNTVHTRTVFKNILGARRRASAEAPGASDAATGDNWLDTHHNPDSPTHRDGGEPDRVPVGPDRHDRWDLMHTYKEAHKKAIKHAVDDVETSHRPDARAKAAHGPIKRFFAWISSYKSYIPNWMMALLLAIFTIGAWWVAVYLVKGKQAAPDGDIFALIILWITAFLAGEAVRGFTHPLLGSIIAGFILRFIPGVEAHKAISKVTGGNLRSIALTIILNRAGLSLDLGTLFSMPYLCAISPTVPLVSEACIVAMLVKYFLKFTYPWAFQTGFLISAVSPAVVVPVLLQLAGQGYGMDKGIPSLVLAVAALCDVFSIAGFSVFNTIIFEKTTLVQSITRAPMELALGVGIGVVLGCFCGFLVPRMVYLDGKESHEVFEEVQAAHIADGRNEAYLRTMLITGFGLFAYYGMHHFEYNGAGAMAVFALGTTAAQLWGRLRTSRVQAQLGFVWTYLAQPLLFGIIGVRIDYKYFYAKFLWKGLVILVISMFGRMFITWLVGIPTNLNTKERVFLAFAWIPKATVQAALGPVALNLALAREGGPKENEEMWGKMTLALAVLAILVTAPMGATIMAFVGPRLLTKADIPEGFELSAE